MMKVPIAPAPITAKFLYPDMFFRRRGCCSCKDSEIGTQSLLFYLVLKPPPDLPTHLTTYSITIHDDEPSSSSG